jgi:hypothetical protein
MVRNLFTRAAARSGLGLVPRSARGTTDSLSQIASNVRQRRFLLSFFLDFRWGFFFAFSTFA